MALCGRIRQSRRQFHCTPSTRLSREPLRVCLLCPFFSSFLEAGSTCLFLFVWFFFWLIPSMLAGCLAHLNTQYFFFFLSEGRKSWHWGLLSRLLKDVFLSFFSFIVYLIVGQKGGALSDCQAGAVTESRTPLPYSTGPRDVQFCASAGPSFRDSSCICLQSLMPALLVSKQRLTEQKTEVL